MPVRTTPEQASSKWAQRLAASTQQITEGVQRVTTAPGVKAAASKDKWLQNVTAAADKWARNVRAVSLEDWKSSMLGIGVQRVAQGAQAKQGKMTSFMQQFFPHLAAGVSTVEQMPSTTLEDNIARMVAMARHNAKFQRSGAGV